MVYKNKRRIGERRSGMIIGELALENNSKRNATAKCSTDCIFFSLYYLDYNSVLKSYKDNEKQIIVSFL